MHDKVRHHRADHDANGAHQHDKDTFAHYLDDGRDIDLNQHQDNKRWQCVSAQARIDDRFAGNDVEVVQKDGRCIDKKQRRNVLKQFGLGNFGK